MSLIALLYYICVMKTRFNSLADLISNLASKPNAGLLLLERLRWDGVITCNKCGCQEMDGLKHYTSGHELGVFKCRRCSQRFRASSGTVFDKCRMPLERLFVGLYILYHYRENVPEKTLRADLQLSRDCGLVYDRGDITLSLLPVPLKWKRDKDWAIINKSKRVFGDEPLSSPELIDKYEAGFIDMKAVFSRLCTMQPKAISERNSIDRSAIEPVDWIDEEIEAQDFVFQHDNHYTEELGQTRTRLYGPQRSRWDPRKGTGRKYVTNIEGSDEDNDIKPDTRPAPPAWQLPF